MLNFLCSLLLQTHNRCRHETKCNVLDWVCSCVSLKFMTLSHPRWLLGRPFWNWFLKLCNWCPELEFRSYSWAYRLKKWTFLWTTIGKMVKEKKKKKKREKRVSLLRDWTRAVCTSVEDRTAWLFANSSLMSNVQYHNDDIFFVKLKLTEKTVEKS